MDQVVSGSASQEPTEQDKTSLSYKFQRLREKLREGIASGELAGKLPGERALAKRFHVNAKTLSKALTDLAAEGLLDRSIGRGTYVKGSQPTAVGKRWLVVCGADQVNWEVVSYLKSHQSQLEIVTNVDALRPSFLNQFSAVIDLCRDTPDSFIRDLVVRNVSVVLVGKEPRVYSTHAVIFDGPFAAAKAGRELVMNGHEIFAAVEPAGCSVVVDALRLTVPRISPNGRICSSVPADAVALFEDGVTAFVCQSTELAVDVKTRLERAGVAVPQQASVLAIGSVPEDPSVSGFFISRAEKAKAIVDLLNDQTRSHPTTIWLAGQYVDRGTMGPRNGYVMLQAAHSGDALQHASL